MPSLPLKANWTGWLYQPPWSEPRAGVASVTVGGVVSMWIRAVVATVIPELHVTSQVFGVPDAALSDDSVTTSQPEVLLTVVSAGDHCHPNLTLERYQAVQLSAGALPTEQAGVTVCALAGAAAVAAKARLAARQVTRAISGRRQTTVRSTRVATRPAERARGMPHSRPRRAAVPGRRPRCPGPRHASARLGRPVRGPRRCRTSRSLRGLAAVGDARGRLPAASARHERAVRAPLHAVVAPIGGG